MTNKRKHFFRPPTWCEHNNCASWATTSASWEFFLMFLMKNKNCLYVEKIKQQAEQTGQTTE